MSDLVRLSFPAAFIISAVHLTAAELVCGYRRGWLSEHDVVTITLSSYGKGVEQSGPEKDLALLLSDELDRVPQLMGEIAESLKPEADSSPVWLFLALTWVSELRAAHAAIVNEHRADYLDPLEVVEMLFTDFDYPDEMQGIVRFIPPLPGAATGNRAIEGRWKDYLTRKAAEYADRP